MRVRWTIDAADDLAQIVDYIAENNRSAAQRTAVAIYKGIAALEEMPNRGRVGRTDGTRELPFTSLPYIAVYEVIEDQVQVLRIRHTSQDWP